jgi:hypothetical protein
MVKDLGNSNGSIRDVIKRRGIYDPNTARATNHDGHSDSLRRRLMSSFEEEQAEQMGMAILERENKEDIQGFLRCTG